MIDLNRLVVWLEAHPRVARVLDRRPVVAVTAHVLNVLETRARLDLQLRCVGAAPARWWEPRAALEERLWRAAVFGP